MEMRLLKFQHSSVLVLKAQPRQRISNIYIFLCEQRVLRRACAYAQSRLSLRCSSTKSKDLDEDFVFDLAHHGSTGSFL